MKKIAIEEHANQLDLTHLEDRLKDMDKAGIDMQVLSFPLIDWGLELPDPVSAAENANNAFSRVVEKHPERFAAFAAISLQDPDAATKELERAVHELGLKGTMLWEEPKGEYLHDRKYRAIFAKAEQLDVPVYLHIRGAIEGAMGDLVGGPMGAYTCMRAMGLIFSGVFDEYPRLKIILGHLGEGIPFWLWRIDNRWLKDKKEGILKADWLDSDLKKKPSQYFKDHFYVTTSGMFWPPAFQLVHSVLGADRILFAADYPPESCAEAAQFIESVSISDGDRKKICHLNAEKLLKL